MKYFRMSAMSLVAALALAACSNDDDVKEPIIDPVGPVSTQGAHFDESNETTTILFAAKEERSVMYTLTRNTTEGDLTIDMDVISASEGLDIPATVTFEDGSASATYTVTAPADAKDGDSYSFEVSIVNADEFAEGATRFSATIAFPIKHAARMWFSGMVSDYGYFLADVYELDGSYLFPDFMSSSTDLWVRYDKNEAGLHECDLTTEPSYRDEDSDNPGCYYLSCWKELEDDENGEWTKFYPHGRDARVNIEYMTYYVSHDGYQATVYNPEAKSGWILLSTVCFYDNQKETDKELNWLQLNWVITDDPESDGFDYSEPAPAVIDDSVVGMFAGEWTMTATDPYCEDASISLPTTNDVTIYFEADEMRMSGLVGTAYDPYGENVGYYTGKYDEENKTVYFYNNTASNGSYEWNNVVANWFYTYDIRFDVVESEGGISLVNNNTWSFYGLNDVDFPTASYGSITLTKK